MADNLTLNAGSGGSTLATDDITDAGGAHYQRVKLTDGTANSETHVHTGNGTSTNALRVTVSSDSTGVLSVDDNGGALTVDNAGTFAVQADSVDGIAAEGAALGNGILLQGDDGTDRKNINVDATTGDVQVDVTNTVTVDGSGVTQPVSGTVTANLSATDNAVLDTIAANTTNLTNCIVQDDAPFTPATGYLMMIGGEFDDAAPDSVDEGDAGNVRITANRSMHVTLRDAAGNERGLNVDANGDIGITNTDISTVAGAVSGSEMQVDVVASLPAGTNAIGKLAANSGVDIGDVDVTSISAGSNLIGDVGISGARTSGGTTLYRNVDVDETEDQVKGTAGQLYWLHAMNLTAAVLYLQVYNATAASVTVGTTTPDLTFPLATQGDTNGAGFTLSIPNGIAFGTAITIACTTTVGGSSGPAANGCIVNLGYA